MGVVKQLKEAKITESQGILRKILFVLGEQVCYQTQGIDKNY